VRLAMRAEEKILSELLDESGLPWCRSGKKDKEYLVTNAAGRKFYIFLHQDNTAVTQMNDEPLTVYEDFAKFIHELNETIKFMKENELQEQLSRLKESQEETRNFLYDIMNQYPFPYRVLDFGETMETMRVFLNEQERQSNTSYLDIRFNKTAFEIYHGSSVLFKKSEADYPFPEFHEYVSTDELWKAFEKKLNLVLTGMMNRQTA
jgi:hypothetical protein